MAINFEQLAQSMGFTGAAADQLARSLQAASNSADRSANALNSEAAAVARATQQTQTFGDKLANTADELISLTGKIISSADGMASSNTVFTQITPMVNMISGIFSKIGEFGGEIGAYLGKLAGTLIGGPAGSLAGAGLGAMVGKYLGGALGQLAPLAAEIFNQYLQQGEKVMGAFNTLSNVGVTFGGSLTEMQRIIRDTGMPLEMLAKVAQSNAENLALLGGGVSGALESVAKAARNDLGPQLVTLYGGFANLSDELVDYMAMERRRGVDQDLLSDNNIESTKAYLYQLKEISALTGKSSKQLKQEIEQRSRNAATQGMLSKMSDTQKKQYDAAMLKVPDAVKGPLQDAFLAFSRGMEPVSTEFLQLQAAAPEAAESIRRMALAANKGPDEFNRVMDQESKNLTVSAGKLTEQMGDLFYLQQAGRLSSSLVDTLNKVITDINSNAVRLKTMGEDSEKFAQQTAALVANAGVFTTSIASVYAAQANLAVRLNGIVLGTKDTGEKFSAFATAVTFTTNVMEKLVDGFDDLISKIAGFGNSVDDNQAVSEVKKAMTANPNSNLARRMASKTSLEISKTNEFLKTLQNELSEASSVERIEYLQNQITTQQEQLKRFEGLKNKYDSIQRETDTSKTEKTSSTSGTNMPTDDNPMPVKTAAASKLEIDFEPLRAMLQPSFDKQSVALDNLATAVGNQGSQVKRVVDRMA
jgi:hypothetical protein